MPDEDEHLGAHDVHDVPVEAGSATRFRWGAASHTGQVRTENEDAFVAGGWLFGVADGMGGHQAGEVASALAADTLRARLSAGAPNLDVVVAAVVEANAAIFQSAHTHVDQRGMGTTLTALATLRHDGDETGEQLALLNVGDSRTYLVRHGRLHRLTVDHSYVQELVATGHIAEHEARTHPRRNIVTRALGIEPTVRIDTWTLPFVRGDRFVLCSDGLVDEVPDTEIEQVAAVVSDPQLVADELVAMANRHGGRDNVTVVVVDVLDGADPPEPTTELPVVATPAGVDDHEREPWRDDSPSPMQVVPAPASSDALQRRAGATRAKRLAIAAGGLVVAMLVVLIAVVANGGSDDEPTVTTVSRTSAPVRSTTPTATTEPDTTPGSSP